MSIVMQIENIKGSVQTSDHADWIPIQSCSVGVARMMTNVGSAVDRSTSVPDFTEMSFTKSSDIASTQLLAQAIYGKTIGSKAVVRWLQTGGEGAAQIFMEVELFDPIITNYSLSGGGDQPMETFTVNFSKVVLKYTQFKMGSEPVAADPKGWDLMTGMPFTG